MKAIQKRCWTAVVASGVLLTAGACGSTSTGDDQPRSDASQGDSAGGSSSGRAGQSSGGAAGSSMSGSGGQGVGGAAGNSMSGSGGQSAGGAAGNSMSGSGGQGASAGSGSAGRDAGRTDSGVDCNCGKGAFTPVCGVDGRTHDATCGISCVPVDIACLGQCPCVDGGGCSVGCIPIRNSNWCQSPTVEWLCEGQHRAQLLRDAGCNELPTGAIRYCCPEGFLSQCQ